MVSAAFLEYAADGVVVSCLLAVDIISKIY